MATLVSDIIRDAYRESNLISIGTEPSGAQREEGIRFINRLVPSVLGYEAGESLVTDYDIRDGDCINNTRLVVTEDTPTTLTLPAPVVDGMRLSVIDPNGLLIAKPLSLKGGRNTIENQKTVTVTNDVDYFFRSDIGNWQKVSSLQETDAWPFPVEFDDMFIITLAFRLNPRYNIASQQESMMMLKRSERQFRARYKQAREVGSDLALLNLLNGPTYSFNSFTRGTV